MLDSKDCGAVKQVLAENLSYILSQIVLFVFLSAVFYFVVDKWNLPMIARFYEEVWSNLTVIDDVIAWKEIVLPELPKESE